MDDILAQLQHDADTYLTQTEDMSSWTVSVLHRLRDYVAIVVAPLKLRVRAFVLQRVDVERIEVRVAGTSILQIVLAPAEVLAGEIAFLRHSAAKKLTTPQIITTDISYNLIPVGVLVCTNCAGSPLCDIADEPMLRLGARQVGRQLRVLHSQAMPGWGWPSLANKWEHADWRAALKAWAVQTTPIQDYTSPAMQTAIYRIWHELISDEYVRGVTPVCIHGDVICQNVYVTVHSHVQLEGIVRPGRLVAGDAMFDLAAVMRGHTPAPLRQGVIEGYTATVPLRSDEIVRIKCLTVLWRIVDLMQQAQISEAQLANSIHAAIDGLRG